MKPQLSKHRILSLCVIGLCVCGAWFGIHAEPQQGKVTRKFIGAWRLVSVEGTNPTVHFAYDHPTGLIIYDRSGWMAVQIAIKGDRKPFMNGIASGTLEEKAAAFDNYVSYYGTYTLDLKAQTVTHHLVDYSYPGGRGKDNVRWFEFQGNDRLLLIPREDGKGGVIDRKNATYKLLWERVK
jgi:Lipocalin-like domain